MSVADELEKLDALRKRGVLTDEEFAAQKKALMAQPTSRGGSPVEATVSNTVTTQATDKKHKEQQLIGGLIFIVGMCVAMFGGYPGWGALMAFAGLVWYFVGRYLAWWNNG